MFYKKSNSTSDFADSQSVEYIPVPKPIDTHLERTTTILNESPQEEQQCIFGKPNSSLGHPNKRRRLSTGTPPPSSRSTSVGRHSINTNASAGPSRKRTISDVEVEVDMQETRIPSSTSPSPMKMPKSRDGSRGSMGPSPAKVSNEVTKALQESITSLLGKRQNSEEDANTAGQQPAKPGKRVRPQPKPKVCMYLFGCLLCADRFCCSHNQGMSLMNSSPLNPSPRPTLRLPTIAH
jgi:DNA replication regulator DPB11